MHASSPPGWATASLLQVVDSLPPGHDAAHALTLLDDTGIEWHFEFPLTVEAILIHCRLQEDALHLDADDLRRLLGCHDQPWSMHGASIALQETTGTLRLLCPVMRGSPRLDNLPETLYQLQQLRNHLVAHH